MGFFDAIAAAFGTLTDNVLGTVNQNHQNKVNLRMMREHNSFNAEQAQVQRDWQEKMWRMNNAYNSPNSMISRGLNPFVQGSAAMAGSRAPASGGAAASAAPVPSMQAFKPNFSNVFNSLASLAQAKKAQSRYKYGSQSYRPHYHLLLFHDSATARADFRDVRSLPMSTKDNPREVCCKLDLAQLWLYGDTTTTVTDGNMQEYVSKYLTQHSDFPQIGRAHV